MRATKHVYDNVCDMDCNVCGEAREVGHVFENEQDADCNTAGCGFVRVVLPEEDDMR